MDSSEQTAFSFLWHQLSKKAPDRPWFTSHILGLYFWWSPIPSALAGEDPKAAAQLQTLVFALYQYPFFFFAHQYPFCHVHLGIPLKGMKSSKWTGNTHTKKSSIYIILSVGEIQYQLRCLLLLLSSCLCKLLGIRVKCKCINRQPENGSSFIQ